MVTVAKKTAQQVKDQGVTTWVLEIEKKILYLSINQSTFRDVNKRINTVQLRLEDTGEIFSLRGGLIVSKNT